jgi:hypothetical protein
MKNARLSIWIKNRPVLQGKFYYRDDKPVFLVNIDRKKWWKNYAGYSISAQILEAFSNARLRVLILYNLKEEGMVYWTKPTTFKKYGILVKWGGHRQYVLPINRWSLFARGEFKLNEPFKLPAMTIDEWLKPEKKEVKIEYVTRKEYFKNMHRLSETFRKILDAQEKGVTGNR